MKRIKFLTLPILISVFACLAVGFTNKPPQKVFVAVDSKYIYLSTNKKTVGELLKEAKIQLDSKDKVKPGLSAKIKQGMTIHIDRAKASNSKFSARAGTIKTSRGDYRYRQALNMEATAYTVDSRYGRRTASGMRAQYGVVAVDRSIIPLGTRLYIEGYGFAVAGDVGSAIKGNRIDLFLETYRQAINFGRRMIRVYILE